MTVLGRITRALGIYEPLNAIRNRVSPARRAQTRRMDEFYARFIRPGELVFDVGANLGQRSERFLAIGARVASLLA